MFNLSYTCSPKPDMTSLDKRGSGDYLAPSDRIRKNHALKLLLNELTLSIHQPVPKASRRKCFENFKPLRPSKVDSSPIEAGGDMGGVL